VPFGGGSYEIRIKGRLSDSLLAVFEGLTASVEPVETVLHGPVQDQAALHGLLDRIQSLGLELIEVRRLPEASGEQRESPRQRGDRSPSGPDPAGK
jgi:hypothetical protein